MKIKCINDIICIFSRATESWFGTAAQARQQSDRGTKMPWSHRRWPRCRGHVAATSRSCPLQLSRWTKHPGWTPLGRTSKPCGSCKSRTRAGIRECFDDFGWFWMISSWFFCDTRWLEMATGTLWSWLGITRALEHESSLLVEITAGLWKGLQNHANNTIGDQW